MTCLGPRAGRASALLPDDNRVLIVAVDHPLYSWPCPGLVDRGALIRKAVASDADGFIASYGTLRDHSEDLASARRILKLDLTTVAMRSYPVTAYRVAWTLDDALRLGADAVLTFVQVGGPAELEALEAAARIAAEADRQGIAYVCEAMPIACERFPDPHDPTAVAAATRAAVELGAHLVKTTLPTPPEGIREAAAFGTPVVVAGGDPTGRRSLTDGIRAALAAGAAGAAVGRNVWGDPAPAEVVAELVRTIHNSPQQDGEP